MSEAKQTGFFQERLAKVARGEKPLPFADAQLVETQYTYGHGTRYDANRRDFGNYDRKAMAQALAEIPEIRAKVEAALTKLRALDLKEEIGAIDDKTLHDLVKWKKKDLLATGLKKRDLEDFAQDHYYIGKPWLQAYIARPEVKLALDKIRADKEFLKTLGLSATDLPSDPEKLQRDIRHGYGAQMLQALAAYPDTQLALEMAVTEKHYEAIKEGHGHLGLFSPSASYAAFEFLRKRGLADSYINEKARNHSTQLPRVTANFLYHLSQDHPLIFDEFAKDRAKTQAATEMQALRNGSVSVGFKYSQWFLRLLQAQEPQTHEKLVPLLVESLVQRDMHLLEKGKLPPGFNLHHIIPLSNAESENQMIPLRQTALETINDRLEHDRSVKNIFNKPSYRLVRQLGKLGLMGEEVFVNRYGHTVRKLDEDRLREEAAALVGKPLSTAQIHRWSDDVRARFRDAGLFEVYLHPENIARNPKKDPTVAFSPADRQRLTKHGLPQDAYETLANAGIRDGKFDREAYRAAAADLCDTLIPKLLAEEKAYQLLAEQGVVGGNSTGLYLKADGSRAIDASRCNLVLINSSPAHPSRNTHAGFHAIMDPQIDPREGASKKVFIVMPQDIIVTAPVDKQLWSAGKAFRDVFVNSRESFRPTWALRFQKLIEPYLPKNATFGGLPSDTPIDRQSVPYLQGFQAGTFYAKTALGQIKIDAKEPILPPVYTPELHAGILEGWEKTANGKIGKATPPPQIETEAAKALPVPKPKPHLTAAQTRELWRAQGHGDNYPGVGAPSARFNSEEMSSLLTRTGHPRFNAAQTRVLLDAQALAGAKRAAASDASSPASPGQEKNQ